MPVRGAGGGGRPVRDRLGGQSVGEQDGDGQLAGRQAAVVPRSPTSSSATGEKASSAAGEATTDTANSSIRS